MARHPKPVMPVEAGQFDALLDELSRRIQSLPGEAPAASRGYGCLLDWKDVIDEIERMRVGMHARMPWVLHEGCECARCRWLRPRADGYKPRGPVGIIR